MWPNVSEEREWEGGKVKNGRHGGRCQRTVLYAYVVTKTCGDSHHCHASFVASYKSS